MRPPRPRIRTPPPERNVKTSARAIDGFGRGHMMARIIGIAVVLVPIVVWFAWRDPGHLVSSAAASGTVVEYEKPIALLTLANGDRVRVYVGPQGAKPGDVLPLLADTYSSGSVQYRVDLKALPAQPNQTKTE